MSRSVRRIAWLGAAACALALSATAARATFGSATLRWTSPGDDGRTGRAVAYDVRYSLSPISAANFHSATQVAGVPPPQPAGELEVLRLSNLVAGNVYYFALETVDDAQNWSAISNLGLYAVQMTAAVASRPGVSLSSPAPNPARSIVRWSYLLPAPGPLAIEAFAVTGRHVREIARAWRSAGAGEVSWDLRDDQGHLVAPGVYLIRTAVAGRNSVTQLVVSR